MSYRSLAGRLSTAAAAVSRHDRAPRRHGVLHALRAGSIGLGLLSVIAGIARPWPTREVIVNRFLPWTGRIAGKAIVVEHQILPAMSLALPAVQGSSSIASA